MHITLNMENTILGRLQLNYAYNKAGDVMTIGLIYSNPSDSGLSQKAPFDIRQDNESPPFLTTYDSKSEHTRFLIITEFFTQIPMLATFSIVVIEFALYKQRLIRC